MAKQPLSQILNYVNGLELQIILESNPEYYLNLNYSISITR